VAADSLDRAEGMRIALSNQVRALGENVGVGSPEQRYVAVMVDSMAKFEKAAIQVMERTMRAHPLYPWVKAQRGIGPKQMGRLLAVLGDPYIHYFKDGSCSPRTVSQLWAYCGYHVISHSSPETQSPNADDTGAAATWSPPYTQPIAVGVAPSRRKHERANWNDAARMRAHLVAESCMKQPSGSRYRDVYEATRLKYADAIHGFPCVRCGPKGKPAPIGSPLRDGHKLGRALRAVAKEILRDLWIESRRLHEADADQRRPEYPTHPRPHLAIVAG
jgi:hypothetical protein